MEMLIVVPGIIAIWAIGWIATYVQYAQEQDSPNVSPTVSNATPANGELEQGS